MLAALAGFALAAVALRLEDIRGPRGEPKSAKPPGADRASDEPHSVQVKRAVEPGHGRSADTPDADSGARLEGHPLAHL